MAGHYSRWKVGYRDESLTSVCYHDRMKKCRITVLQYKLKRKIQYIGNDILTCWTTYSKKKYLMSENKTKPTEEPCDQLSFWRELANEVWGSQAETRSFTESKKE